MDCWYYIIVKRIISSFLVLFRCLETVEGISLALNILASIRDLEYFCSSNVFFQFFKRFFFLHFNFQQLCRFFLQERAVYLLSNAVGGLT